MFVKVLTFFLCPSRGCAGVAFSSLFRCRQTRRLEVEFFFAPFLQYGWLVSFLLYGVVLFPWSFSVFFSVRTAPGPYLTWFFPYVLWPGRGKLILDPRLFPPFSSFSRYDFVRKDLKSADTSDFFFDLFPAQCRDAFFSFFF